MVRKGKRSRQGKGKVRLARPEKLERKTVKDKVRLLYWPS
jgi:hypothetical protein